MKKIFFFLLFTQFLSEALIAQLEPTAGKWKTWFITSGKEYRLPAPASNKAELNQVISAQQNLDANGLRQIDYWNMSAPGFHWQEMLSKLWTVDTSYFGILSNMLLGVATYDATIAAWDTKYAYNRSRPFSVDNRIKAYTIKPESPSYPCELSVAAGVGVTIISHFYPAMADSVKRMAQRAMDSRIAAGVAYPSDTKAGFELGKTIAEKEIAYTKDFVAQKQWDGKMPDGPGLWKGKNPMFPMAGQNRTVVLTSANQFRPGPPPDFAKDMAEMKAFKQTARTTANAYNFASGYGEDLLQKKILEYNIHLNPPRSARMQAIAAVGVYDAFVACWDAKYAYWGIRPTQYDTTFKSLLMTPPFPGYPSGHAAIGSVIAEICTYFFPADSALFQKRAKDGAESRFHAGIHFRTDNEVALVLGKKVAAAVIERAKLDGADADTPLAKLKKTEQALQQLKTAKNAN